MTRTFALCVSIAAVLFCGDRPLSATELEPLETIKLHNVTEFPDQVRLANTRDEKGQYQGAITAEHVSTIYRTGTPHEHSMHCNISLDESAQNTAFEAGKRPLVWGMIKKNYWDYRLRQGFIYPLPYGELYRVEDLTQTDQSGNYAVLKRVTRKELGIDIPVDYSRQYIPIQWPKDSAEGGGSQSAMNWSFSFVQEPDIYTNKMRTVLRCSQSLPVVFVMREKLKLPQMASMIVEEGTVLPVLDCGFKILKIVPPNVEKKVCGWVEIDPRPILLRTPLGRALDKLEQLEKQKSPPQPPLAPIPDPKP